MRREFSNKTKMEAWNRSGGNCEQCGLPIKARAEYDHITPCGLGGDNSLDNCAVLCAPCHRDKTHKPDGDKAKIDKADRLRKKAAGIIRPNSKLAKRNRWTPAK